MGVPNKGSRTRAALSKTQSIKSRKPITDELRRILGETVPNDPKQRTYVELVVYKLVLMAIRGNPAAIKEILDRIDGRVPQRTAGHDDTPVQIEIISHIARPPRLPATEQNGTAQSTSLPATRPEMVEQEVRSKANYKTNCLTSLFSVAD
jgi:hypothetical protein